MAVYRPATNEWQGVAPLPAARQAGDGAVAIGGRSTRLVATTPRMSSPGACTPDSPCTETWVAKAGIPVASGGGTSHAISARLYVTDGVHRRHQCGVGAAASIRPQDRYVARAQERPGRPSLSRRGRDRRQLYVVGGYDGTGASATLDVYDPATNTWVTKASMPTARRGAAGATYGGKLYVIGGATRPGTTSPPSRPTTPRPTPGRQGLPSRQRAPDLARSWSAG